MELHKKLIKRTGTNIAIVLYNVGWHVAHDTKEYHRNRKVTPIYVVLLEFAIVLAIYVLKSLLQLGSRSGDVRRLVPVPFFN